MDSSESNTNQSVMAFGNKSSESGERSSDRPHALPANVDTSMTSENDPSDQQEFGFSLAVLRVAGRETSASVSGTCVRPIRKAETELQGV